jgi:type III pantothenate kinase
MILTVDIGNTNITIGVFNNNDLLFTARLATDRKRTEDQYAVELLNIFKLRNADISEFSGAIISSVVPELTDVLKAAVSSVTTKDPMILRNDIGSGLKVINDINGQIGADIAAVAVAAINQYPLPCFVLDLGTATKIILLDENGMFMGCTISPGVGISLYALASRTSQLPTINLETPDSSIGTNTVDCMKSGLVYGTAAMLDGLTERMEKDFGKKVASIIATGGLSKEIIKNCNRTVIYDENLILHGLKVIYDKNS